MHRLAAAILLTALSTLASGSTALAAQGVELVCLVTYSNAMAAKTNDAVGVTAASVMPRETATPIVSDYSKIYDYADQATLIRACQCLQGPAPANNLAERDATLESCPKPTRIE